METPQTIAVRAYYDKFTKGFIRHGHGGRNYAIHRAVWGPGVRNRPEAIEYPNSIILDRVAAHGARRVIDLGCGLGGAIAYMARRYPAEYVGLTVSPVQVEAGNKMLRPRFPRDTARIVVGDYHDPAAVCAAFGPSGADSVFAVESLIHSSEPELFFRSVSGALRDGGILIVIDDFISDDSRHESRDDRSDAKKARRFERDLSRFRTGWRVGSPLPLRAAVQLAEAVGLSPVDDRDLSPFLELGRPRDRLFSALAPFLRLFGGWRRWGHITGGVALQRLLRRGELGYHALVFQKREAAE